ncbi:amidohydrolase [Nocardioides lijunqiniae]|uniref:amidohydrolase n=1 Tax=Nocardioides lijunqiniae TaxID=2760832 RepID=UPI001878E0DC|nr:amidohydrolase [Nocardioides lijunqiniae]
MTTTVLHGGALFTGTSTGTGYAGRGAVVVRDGRVADVVLGDDVPDVPGAARVDLAGGLLAPGFVDAHVHAVQGGLERIRCDLSELDDRDAYLAHIGAYAREHPELPWILGGGWAMSAFPGGNPTAADLDRVVPDRPVFLPNRDHHGAWVNSRALQLAGVDASTPDPPHGRFERDADGRPTGTLHEGAMHAVAQHAPATSEEEYYRALLAGQSYLHSLGVTGWQDAIVGSYAGMDDPGPTYLRAARRGDLTAHVVGALWWDRERGEEQVADLVARREAYTHGRFRATSVKVMQDGVAENGTAALLTPYLDRCGHATDSTGHSFVDPAALRRHVARLDAEGFQVHVHGIGDRGVREALDAFEGLDPAHDRRHQVAHLQLVHPDDVPRFGRLGVAANIQALWACLDEQMVELTLPFLGEERAGWQYPFGDLHRAGARLVAGSDWPVSTPDPLQAIHTAVTRTAYGESGRAGDEPFLPHQALDLATAFAAYTSGSAWVNHRDDAGRLAPGAVADLVVLDRDPFAGPADEIGSARVVSTWIDGTPVYEA